VIALQFGDTTGLAKVELTITPRHRHGRTFRVSCDAVLSPFRNDVLVLGEDSVFGPRYPAL
jgi:hypothetical protein